MLRQGPKAILSRVGILKARDLVAMASSMTIILHCQGSMGSNPKSSLADSLLLCRASEDRVVS